MTFRTEMNSSYLQYEGADGDRSSVRSSEASGGSPSGEEWRERSRLESKIEKIKMKISKVNLSCEADVESFLQMSRETEKTRGADNPQMARIKQHFEKSNKRNTQDLESLQKKLATYEQRLRDLDSKDVLDTSSRSANLVSSVGHGIRRTGATVKELTGTVISAPLDIAHMIRNSFGSADNINDSADVSNVGQSTFYARSENAAPSSTTKSSTLPPGLRMDSISTGTPEKGRKPPTLITSPDNLYFSRRAADFEGSSNESIGGGSDAPAGQPSHLDGVLREVLAELRATREANAHLSQQMAEMTDNVQKELKFFEKSLQEDRFRYQKLEEQLNETIDLHQAEVNVVRQDLGNIANRLDYQYNDRFKRVEESVESAHNQMFRMESSLKESMDMRLQGGAWWNAIMLGGANVLVELLKLILFLIATILDFFKPFTGTRTRTGLLIVVILVVFVVCQNVDFAGLLQIVLPGKKRRPAGDL